MTRHAGDGEMKPYYQDEAVTIYHGDCRAVLNRLQGKHTLVTDPVWPSASVPLVGSDRPEALFQEMWVRGVWNRAAVQLGCDTPPFFLDCIPYGLGGLKFFRHCWLEVARVGYKGRLLMTGDIAMLFGEPPASRPGARVIPGKCMDADSGGKQSDHPCPRKLKHVRLARELVDRANGRYRRSLYGQRHDFACRQKQRA